ncbi:MAG: hypothetical protein CMG98_02565 [Marinovum sp.]|nr:hypothetical protein [Marinovum sp.]
MLARSVGFQHLLVSHFATDWFNKSEAPSLFDFHLVERALHHFDKDEGLHLGPLKRQLQNLSLPLFWALFTKVKRVWRVR